MIATIHKPATVTAAVDAGRAIQTTVLAMYLFCEKDHGYIRSYSNLAPTSDCTLSGSLLKFSTWVPNLPSVFSITT